MNAALTRHAEHDRQKLLHEYDGKQLIKHCEKRGADTRNGAGDHVIVSYRGSTQVFVSRKLGHGLQAKLVKWMLAVGLAVLVLTWVL